MTRMISGSVVDRALIDSGVVPEGHKAMSVALDMRPNSVLSLTVVYAVDAEMLRLLSVALARAAEEVGRGTEPKA